MQRIKKNYQVSFSEAHSEPCQTFKMECFALYFMAFSRYIFPKLSILDFGLGAEYAPDFIDIFPFSTF